MLTIARAETEPQFAQVRFLMSEYIAWVSAATQAHGLDAEELLAFYYATRDDALPGACAPPDGCLLLASDVAGQAAGFVAFERQSDVACEMKRLYVRPAFRGMHAGRRLAERLIFEAREAGYRAMRLETRTFMPEAIALYLSLGFSKCEPYHEIPASFRDATVFMELRLN